MKRVSDVWAPMFWCTKKAPAYLGPKHEYFSAASSKYWVCASKLVAARLDEGSCAERSSSKGKGSSNEICSEKFNVKTFPVLGRHKSDEFSSDANRPEIEIHTPGLQMWHCSANDTSNRKIKPSQSYM